MESEKERQRVRERKRETESERGRKRKNGHYTHLAGGCPSKILYQGFTLSSSVPPCHQWTTLKVIPSPTQARVLAFPLQYFQRRSIYARYNRWLFIFYVSYFLFRLLHVNVVFFRTSRFGLPLQEFEGLLLLFYKDNALVL